MLGESDMERKLYDTSTTACNRAASELQQRKLYDTSTTACNRAATELQQRKLYDTSTTACNRAATELQQRKLYDTSTTALAGKTESKVEKAFQELLKRQDEFLRASLKTPVYVKPKSEWISRYFTSFFLTEPSSHL